VAAAISESGMPMPIAAFDSISESLEDDPWSCSRVPALDMIEEESKSGVVSLRSPAMASRRFVSMIQHE
jgi:hypothetical protein